MTTPLVIVGCGGFGREVHDVVEAVNADAHPGNNRTPTWDFLGYVDDAPSEVNAERVANRGGRILGGIDWLIEAPAEVHYVIGINSPGAKRTIEAKLGNRPAATLVHPSATFGHGVELGPGTVVCANSCLTTNIRLGRHVHINLLCSIGHDTTIDDYVSINPLVAVSGTVHLQAGVTMGTHSCILQNLTVGVDAVIGGAACVVKDVPPGVTVKGVPAR